MRHFEVLSLFPQLFEPFLADGLIGRARRGGLMAVEVLNFRRFGLGKHLAVDEVPYGGGAGMVLRPEPLFAAVRERRTLHEQQGRTVRVALMTPQGRPFTQDKAREMAGREEVTLLVCGRYEGFDERIRLALADEEISLGDFVMLGGEVAAMAVIEAVVRLIPGVLGNADSMREESFSAGRLEYPQYTRPAEFEGMAVPEILLSGDHARIAAWREEQALRRTRERRPELLDEEE
ncbi:MAG: tRNA (guanosine(37)-N1)-methyltransferase TrmD [Deltaproteobacteria bacterium]|nr:tRNA (guanosine(37)-N1)-methyltransferase TrmD [Deltaproteobacteria bacterium]